MSMFLTSFISVGLLFCLAIPGFVLKKLKMLPDSAVGVLVTVLLYVAQPFLTISSFAKKAFETELLANMGWTIVFTIGIIIILHFMCTAIFSIPKDKVNKGIYSASSYMCNCSFMGIPLLQAFFPDKPELLIYCAVFIVIFNMLAWSLCVFTITGERKHINIKKIFLNPPTVALIVALPIFFSGWKMPVQLSSTVDFLAHMTTPLSMIILGVRMAQINLVEMFANIKNYSATFIKVIICPLIALGVMLLVRLVAPISDDVIMTICILMAMPTAATVVIMAERFKQNSDIAVKVAVLSSLFSIITIPLLMMLLGVVLG